MIFTDIVNKFLACVIVVWLVMPFVSLLVVWKLNNKIEYLDANLTQYENFSGWHHWLVTFGKTTRVYVDGRLMYEGFESIDKKVSIGIWLDAKSYYVTQPYYSETTLSDDEVNRIYSSKFTADKPEEIK